MAIVREFDCANGAHVIVVDDASSDVADTVAATAKK